MRIAIIEDEKLTAEDLAETILKVEPNIKIVTTLYSVKEAVSYFQKNEKPDLIFCDIQLGDGLSFEIFKAIHTSTPVIFCTAYDEYALNAFKANGIDYILKPFTKKTIATALDRYKELKNNLSQSISGYEKISELFENRKNQQDASVLVYIKDKIVPVKINDIALFYIENEITHFFTFKQNTHTINKTLDELEKLTGNSFYRANRKFLISRKAIKDASQYFHRKLLVNLSIPFTTNEPITISKVKVTDFLNWLSGN
ncbi:MAG: DNA-binding response regulator [Bacteroidetes bacterium GWA2_30_7]|nr:MAG: DNA-binding response regulator [Bacteroidetes bacterium GWA2_30_7]